MKCPICFAPAQDTHFGSTVFVCRACSAFFRRFVLSPKRFIKCVNKGTCTINYENSRNCRFCRMTKCLDAGMKKTAIQGPRDKYSNSLPSPSSPDLSPMFSEMCPRLNILHQNFQELQSLREQFYQPKNQKPKYRDMNGLFEVLTKDIKFVEKFINRSYHKELGDQFSKFEKKTLLHNYFIKHINFELIFQSTQKGITEMVLPNGDFLENDIGQFYIGHIKKPSNLTKKDMELFFKRYWEHFERNVINDVRTVKPDIFEFLTVCSLMFWDTGLEDFSTKSVEICQKMRNQIISEFSKYLSDFKKVKDPFIRLGEIMLLLVSNQKSFTTCQEELEMCGVYNIYQHMPLDAHKMISDSLSV